MNLVDISRQHRRCPCSCGRRASTDKAVEERISMFTEFMGAAVHGHGHHQKSAGVSLNKHYATKRHGQRVILAVGMACKAMIICRIR